MVRVSPSNFVFCLRLDRARGVIKAKQYVRCSRYVRAFLIYIEQFVLLGDHFLVASRIDRMCCPGGGYSKLLCPWACVLKRSVEPSFRLFCLPGSKLFCGRPLRVFHFLADSKFVRNPFFEKWSLHKVFPALRLSRTGLHSSKLCPPSRGGETAVGLRPWSRRDQQASRSRLCRAEMRRKWARFRPAKR
jgi:hypothetical protein